MGASCARADAAPKAAAPSEPPPDELEADLFDDAQPPCYVPTPKDDLESDLFGGGEAERERAESYVPPPRESQAAPPAGVWDFVVASLLGADAAPSSRRLTAAGAGGGPTSGGSMNNDARIVALLKRHGRL